MTTAPGWTATCDGYAGAVSDQPTRPWLHACDDDLQATSELAYRIAFGLTRNRHEAEDLSQDVLLRLVRHHETDPPQNLDGWLYRVTVNLFRDRLRRARRIRMEPLRASLSEPGLAPICSLEEAVIGSLPAANDLCQAVSSLSPQLRRAVLMRDVHGLTYDEIADHLGAKRNTVASWILRGRRQLRDALADRDRSGDVEGYPR